MKKLIIASIAFVSTAVFAAPSALTSKTRAKASAFTEPGVSINPVVGVAITSLAGPSNTSSTTGFVAGGLIDIGVGVEKLEAETGLMLIQQGTGITNTGYNDFTYTNNYVALPVLAKYTALEANGNSLHLKGGFMPQVLATSRLAVKNGNRSKNEDARDTFNNFDLPIMLGVGGVISTGAQVSITADVAFLRGLTRANAKTVTNDNSDVYNQGVMFTAGAMF